MFAILQVQGLHNLKVSMPHASVKYHRSYPSRRLQTDLNALKKLSFTPTVQHALLVLVP